MTKKDKIEKKESEVKKLPDNVEEYFAKTDGNTQAFHSRALLTANNEDTDLKTDLLLDEIKYINTLYYNDELLKSKGLKPAFEIYLNKYMRLKFSLDRKSRKEFVDINKNQSNVDDAIQVASGISNITNSKK